MHFNRTQAIRLPKSKHAVHKINGKHSKLRSTQSRLTGNVKFQENQDININTTSTLTRHLYMYVCARNKTSTLT